MIKIEGPSILIGFVLFALVALSNVVIAHEVLVIPEGIERQHHSSSAIETSASVDEAMDKILYQWTRHNLSNADSLAKVLLRNLETNSSGSQNGNSDTNDIGTKKWEVSSTPKTAVGLGGLLDHISQAIPYAECVMRHWGESHAVESDRRTSTALENLKHELDALQKLNFFEKEAASYIKEAMIHVKEVISNGKQGHVDQATLHAWIALDFAEAAARISQCRGRFCVSSTVDAGHGGDSTSGLLTTGNESLPEIFEKAQCTVCHSIPGIRGAKSGDLGPELYLKTNAPKRIKDSGYHGVAPSVREYILESIIDPNLYVVPGFDADLMPDDFGTTLNAKTLFRIVDYLAQLEESKYDEVLEK